MKWLEEYRTLDAEAQRLDAALRVIIPLPHRDAALDDIWQRERKLWELLPAVYETARTEGDAAAMVAAPVLSATFPRDERIRIASTGPGAVVAQFAVLRARLGPLLDSPEPRWAARVELAIVHLNRSLQVDATLRSRWKQAWDEKDERGVEGLGAVHFLSHALFAFKASTTGQETDLVLGDLLRRSDSERSAAPLVLTEWKKVTEENLAAQVKSAHNQLELYNEGVAATLQLTHSRYMLLVSVRPMRQAPPDRRTQRGHIIRVANVVIEAKEASVEAKRILPSGQGSE